jgi:DNA-binding response OmpR family regulator
MTKTLNQKQTEAKGFALYVGISESEAESAGITLSEIAIQLRQRLAELVPGRESETYAALAIGPRDSKGRNLQLTRTALGEPRATEKLKPVAEEETAARGVVIDLNRRRLYVDGKNASLTCKEFELLAFLVENEGRTVSREEIASISERCGEPTPNPRTIDVHVRRLRSKIAGYEDIVRTARGRGYRFDRHKDVLIEL